MVQTHSTWQSAASPIHTSKVTVPEKPAPPVRLNAKSSKGRLSLPMCPCRPVLGTAGCLRAQPLGRFASGTLTMQVRVKNMLQH